MPLTPEDIHEAFLQTRQENYQDTVMWGVPWESLSDKEKLCYDRMAELLNEKAIAAQPVPSDIVKGPTMLEFGDVCSCDFCQEGRAIARRIMEAK